MYNQELITFITVADQGSFLKAAQVLHTTPASVMNQMNKLERMIGAKLLERTNHGTSLTAAGKSIYEDAKRMIEFADESERRARQFAAMEKDVPDWRPTFPRSAAKSAALSRCAIPTNEAASSGAEKSLIWFDQDGETLVIVKNSETSVLSRMRDDVA